jgi:hypothetical protein
MFTPISAVVIAVTLGNVPPQFAGIENSASQLAQTALEKQKSRPFWVRLRSITFGNLPYVFDVKSCIVKYEDNKERRAEGSQSHSCPDATGVFTPIDDIMFYTPITLAGKPVVEKERRTWERKREEKIAAAKARSESEKAKIRADEEQNRKERARFWDEFMRAFRFEIVEHRIVDNRPTTILSFVPNANYKPGGVIDTKYLPKLLGQVWIDDADIEIARFQIQFKDDVTAGFGLFGRVYAGSSYFMDLKKGIDDRWLPAKAETILRMRQGLVVKTNQKYTYEYDNYRRFTTDVKIPERDPQ